MSHPDHQSAGHHHAEGRAPLNIALISGSMPPMPCGVGDNALELARALVARGHRVTVYTHLDADAIDEGSLQVKPLVGNWNWSGCHLLTQQLVLDDPDLIQIEYPTKAYGSNTGPLNLAMFLKLRHFRGPVVLRLHEWGRAHWLRRLALWPLLNDSDGIMVPSRDMRDDLLLKHRSLKDRPLQVIPVGPVIPDASRPSASEAAWEAQLRDWGVPKEAFPLLLSFGFVRKDKGLESLAAAVAELKKSSQVHVLHLGPFEPAQDPQQELVLDAMAQYQVVDRLHFVGHQPLSLLPATPPKGVAAVFPYVDGVSDRRSAAITLGMLGYPVLTTTPANAETAAVWGELATLIPPRDVPALTAAIRALGVADAWPAGHAAEFAARFGWDVLTDQVEAFYEDVFEHYRILVDPGYYPAAMAGAAAHDAGGHH